MKDILKKLNQKPIAYYPIYRQITGSTTGGILLSQLMYWFSKKDKIFKTDSEIMEETYLSEKELRNAKKLIKNLDFITVSREGLPAKTFYEINWDKMITSLAQRAELEKPKGENSTRPKGGTVHDQRAEHSIYTENTTENTTENKNIKKEFSFTLSQKTSLENTSKEYQDRLREYIASSGKSMSYDEFYSSCVMKGYKYKNFKLAYDKWNNKPATTVQQPQQQTKPTITVEQAVQEYIFDISNGVNENIAVGRAKEKVHWDKYKELDGAITDVNRKIYQQFNQQQHMTKEEWERYLEENSPI